MIFAEFCVEHFNAYLNCDKVLKYLIKFLLVISYFATILNASGPKLMAFCFLMHRINIKFVSYVQFSLLFKFWVADNLLWVSGEKHIILDSFSLSLFLSPLLPSHYCKLCLPSYYLAQSLLLLWYLFLQNKVLFSWINCVLLSLFSPYHI